MSPGWQKMLAVIGCWAFAFLLIVLAGKLDLNWWMDLIVALCVPFLVLGAPWTVLHQKALF